MKKYMVPLLLALSVFCITVIFQRFTLLRQEGLGLFLNTPDFFRDLLFDPFPLSNLIGSFFVQFYGNFVVGAFIVTGMVLIAYSVWKSLLRRLGIDIEAINVIIACAAWYFIAKASNPAMGVIIDLCSFGLLIIVAAITRALSWKLQERISFRNGWIDLASVACAICVTVMAIIFSPSIRNCEKWSKIEFAAVQGAWNYLLKTATPKEARKDYQVTPFALLALNAQGRLADEFQHYPISDRFGLDFGDDLSYRSSLFNAVLFSNLGCHNEAIHKTHQCGDFLPHCTSFRTLRMLVKENHAAGDSLLVVKYCDILDRSLTHRKFTQYYREHPCSQRVSSTSRESSEAELITTKDPMYTMLQMGKAGISSAMIMERYYCYRQISEYFKAQ